MQGPPYESTLYIRSSRALEIVSFIQLIFEIPQLLDGYLFLLFIRLSHRRRISNSEIDRPLMPEVF
ncbi:hypothetical protein ASPZODRAFT_834529 [Penicilliopsis zonata CBS 506.65]|uniref:Uncharacterized protein n=1 Tax=Penicilliopsis zonata CBS 506.65 TaxID=1073090 RepID=A0A1L9SAB0_9EURO|nr:hypothetical protein ASPZODRAFT_834529 [Penicilliopsis zonata CBS 506.65]OJJ44120.1 hypothetical protein ASPZODRAFT_834529 [Penicilliopsis zonata CBS 506.65]